MSHYEVTQNRIVNASAQELYDVFANYHGDHQAILPKSYFKQVVLNQGGVGEGTEVTVTMEIFGSQQVYNMRLREKEPGRVLLEEDLENDTTTTFTFEPINGGQQTHVTIATTIAVKPGLRGMIDRIITPPVLRKIYREELENLSNYIAE